VRAYIAENIFQIFARNDLSATTESLVGDCCSQGSFLDTMRQHISCYAWDHYGEFDPEEAARDTRLCPGSVVRVMDSGLELDTAAAPGAVLDVGCSVGRTSFELAERNDALVLGIDLNFSMLRLAATALQTSRVTYPRRRAGLVYDQRSFAVSFPQSERVDFWACDACALPFPAASFGRCVAMNILDSIASPAGLVRSLGRGLSAHGSLLVACPYDWSVAATPVEAWLGGHSQRGPDHGDCASRLRRLLSETPEADCRFQIISELERVPWRVRMHERSSVTYEAHVVSARRSLTTPAANTSAAS
jgi:SAM-dependent methyltransferase